MYYIKTFLIVSLVSSIIGYIIAVLREKYYLKRNIIILDNSSITPDDFSNLDMKQMSYRGTEIKTGDEISIKTRDSEIIRGTLIGGNYKKGMLKMITTSNEIREVYVRNIEKLKLLQEYGKFFTF